MYAAGFVFGAAEGIYPSVTTKINSNWMLPRERQVSKPDGCHCPDRSSGWCFS